MRFHQLAIFTSLVSLISFCSCENTDFDKFVTDKSGNVLAEVILTGIKTLDRIECTCRVIGQPEEKQIVRQYAPPCWKFVDFQVLVIGYNSSLVKFWPSPMQDTDKLSYDNFNYELCRPNYVNPEDPLYGDSGDYFLLENSLYDYYNREQNYGDNYYRFIYMIPSTAISDKFYYWIAVNDSSYYGNLSLRRSWDEKSLEADAYIN